MNKLDENRLKAIYEMLPEIECKQKCANGCGPITMSYGEAERIVEKTGSQLRKCKDDLVCRYLKNENHCSIHEFRPILCRLWGVVDTEEMHCPHGCEVIGNRLSKEQAYMIMQLIEMIAGHKTEYIGTHPANFEKKLAEVFGVERARQMMQVKNPMSTGY